jgi:hypothetical protein
VGQWEAWDGRTRLRWGGRERAAGKGNETAAPLLPCISAQRMAGRERYCLSSFSVGFFLGLGKHLATESASRHTGGNTVESPVERTDPWNEFISVEGGRKPSRQAPPWRPSEPAHQRLSSSSSPRPPRIFVVAFYSRPL